MTSRKTPSYQFQWPNPDAFIIKNPNFGLAGPQQSTLQKITFQEICSYIECEDAYHYCDTPIRPKGHCCDICGTMATFSQQNFNYDRAQQALREFEVKQDNNTGFSLIRIKDFGKMPLFQLSVIPDKNENFDADKYRHLLYEVYYVVQEVQETPTQFHSTRVEVGFSQWKASSFFAKFINFLVVIFIASVVGVGILKYEVHKNQRLRSFINRRRLPLQTVWYRGDEDVDLNLPTTQVVDRRLGAEGHVESDTFVNPVFDFEDPEKVPKAENDENKLNFEDSEVKMSSLVDIDTL
ncbi:unnamed protein product [Bursaphelenchus okinawaensis]|uniref:Protein amnionless n=1 Tax=Bursaphelenchus okinawaensis TaxID=465554 RepID=A0A811LEX8_9BILA|nr:unnamed protein product [Bursaphelenchus okinawaensis]CAG9121933.1 unnamed protein product [Bursaphelenchus okinawaensis]